MRRRISRRSDSASLAPCCCRMRYALPSPSPRRPRSRCSLPTCPRAHLAGGGEGELERPLGARGEGVDPLPRVVAELREPRAHALDVGPRAPGGRPWPRCRRARCRPTGGRCRWPPSSSCRPTPPGPASRPAGPPARGPRTGSTGPPGPPPCCCTRLLSIPNGSTRRSGPRSCRAPARTACTGTPRPAAHPAAGRPARSLVVPRSSHISSVSILLD